MPPPRYRSMPEAGMVWLLSEEFAVGDDFSLNIGIQLLAFLGFVLPGNKTSQ